MITITYYGHSCFLVESNGLKVLLDPFSPLSGYVLPPLQADIVLSSHMHLNHNYLDAVSGTPSVVRGSGDRTLGWLKVRGIPSYHDRARGEVFGSNTIFVWEMQAIRFCHLGDLGHVLTLDQLAHIGEVDVLFLPVGGNTVLTLEDADLVLKNIPARYIIPMHYKTAYYGKSLYTLEQFLAGRKHTIIPEPGNRFILTRAALQEKKTEIIAMQYCDLPEEDINQNGSN